MEELWKKTADLFSGLIDKPKMTEKHLLKPHPKYIFDIILSTMSVTKFPEGLYTEEELNPKNFDSEKSKRSDFLQKAIDITKIVNGETIEVKVKNILAGEEPDKTNLFLQSFYKAAKSGKDFPKYITKYLNHIKKKELTEAPAKVEKQAAPVKEEKPIVKKEEPVKKEEKPIKKEEKPVQKIESKPKIEEKPKVEEKKPAAVQKKEDVVAKPAVKKEEVVKQKERVQEEEDRADLGVDKESGIKMGGLKLGKDKKVTANNTNVAEAPKKPSLNLKDIESIKNYIHEISTNANPISKLIDYLPEDIDSMNKELSHWKAEALKYSEMYEDEIKKSEEVIFPLEKEYLELDETIKDELTRIKSIKQRILTNELIVQNLINGVISVKNYDK